MKYAHLHTILLGMALGALGCAKESSAAANEAPGARPTAAAETTAKPAAGARLNQTVSFDDSDWVVLEAKDGGKTLKANDSFSEPKKTEGKYVLVRFKVTNKTKQEERLIETPKLVDGKGREFGHLDDEALYVPAKAKTLALEALPPSMAREFWSVFEVAADSTDLSFLTRELGFAGDKKPVTLGI